MIQSGQREQTNIPSHIDHHIDGRLNVRQSITVIHENQREFVQLNLFFSEWKLQTTIVAIDRDRTDRK